MSWDKQFKAGVWCRERPSQHTISKVAELCNGGYLVEFGCGEGTLPLALPSNSFSGYIGYDISEVAVCRARHRAYEAGLTRCRFEQGDMAKWKGGSGITLIVAEECLYYLSPRGCKKFLQRSCESLVPGGSILIIVHSAVKHFRTIGICRRSCLVRDESINGQRAYLVLNPKDT
jgi:trans-aconitate methyltransferase